MTGHGADCVETYQTLEARSWRLEAGKIPPHPSPLPLGERDGEGWSSSFQPPASSLPLPASSFPLLASSLQLPASSLWHLRRLVWVVISGLWSLLAGLAWAGDATDLNNRGVTEAKAGRFEEGVSLLRQAIAQDPGDETIRKNLSGMLSDWAPRLDQRGRGDDAVEALREAIRHDPDNGWAYVTLGDLLYLRHSRLDEAIDMWRRAHGKVPPAAWPGVSDRIAQAGRDQTIERGFTARESAHFELRFQAHASLDAARLEQALEDAYERLAGEFGRGPPRLTVLVYSERDLRRVYNQRDWAVGFYDGRVRLRADDVASALLPDLLSHELAHAFLHHLYGAGVPVWVHEGYAQLQERPRTLDADGERLMAGLKDRSQWIPLGWLDRRFSQPTSQEDVLRAYLEAKMAVEAMVARHGTPKFHAFLGALTAGRSPDEAYEEACAPARWALAERGLFE